MVFANPNRRSNCTGFISIFIDESELFSMQRDYRVTTYRIRRVY